MSTSHILAEIGDERTRQILSEGYDHQHDDAHDDFELARAASVLTTYATMPEIDRWVAVRHGPRLYGAELLWPWDLEHFKLTNPRRDLIKAAALIVAEIERLDRAALQADAA